MNLNENNDASKKGKNVFTDTDGVIAREGLHKATVLSTQHVGKRKTKYGMKDFQMFHLRVTQFNDATEKETAEIHQQYHRSLDPKAALVPFLAAFGITTRRGMTIDFDDLVGKTLNIVVTHTTDANGTTHANIQPVKAAKSGGAQ